MTERRTLSPEDWTRAAFQALVAKGPRAIRAEALARGLNVSKGSFYWHFADVPTLEAAMIARWEAEATAPEAKAAGPEARLAALTGPGGHETDAAMRDWARSDPRAAEAVERVEALRLSRLKEALIAANARQPGRAARLIRAALIGMEALPGQNADDRGKDIALLLKKLLP